MKRTGLMTKKLNERFFRNETLIDSLYQQNLYFCLIYSVFIHQY